MRMGASCVDASYEPLSLSLLARHFDLLDANFYILSFHMFACNTLHFKHHTLRRAFVYYDVLPLCLFDMFLQFGNLTFRQ